MKPGRYKGKSEGAIIGWRGDTKGVADNVEDFDIF